MTEYKPIALATEALEKAQRLPFSFWPIPVRETATKTTPCFRSKATRQTCAWELASALFMAPPTHGHFVKILLRAYVTACRKEGGDGYTEALSKSLGEGPLLPPDSLFAPMDDNLEEIITGFGRTLLKLRGLYELVLPRITPTMKDIVQCRNVFVDYVRHLVTEDPDHARVYVETFCKRLTALLDDDWRKPR